MTQRDILDNSSVGAHFQKCSNAHSYKLLWWKQLISLKEEDGAKVKAGMYGQRVTLGSVLFLDKPVHKT